MCRWVRRWLVIGLLGFSLGAPPAGAEELVKFASAATVAQPAVGIEGYLDKPKGQGPFPAVVLLHSCLGPSSDRRAIGAMLAEWGYVALFVDDFATRGLTETCAVDFPQGPADAFGALSYVAGLAYVDRSRIAVVGYSQGGDTALKIAVRGLIAPFTTSRGPAFKAVAAYYPPCSNLGRARLDLPTLVLVGAADSVTPAAPCAKLARGQSNVTLRVYPGASHVFDDPAFAGGKELFGMHLQYDPDAAGQAAAALREFLASELRQ